MAKKIESVQTSLINYYYSAYYFCVKQKHFPFIKFMLEDQTNNTAWQNYNYVILRKTICIDFINLLIPTNCKFQKKHNIVVVLYIYIVYIYLVIQWTVLLNITEVHIVVIIGSYTTVCREEFMKN